MRLELEDPFCQSLVYKLQAASFKIQNEGPGSDDT